MQINMNYNGEVGSDFLFDQDFLTGTGLLNDNIIAILSK